MFITMVKKRLSNGQACKKCIQAEQLLQRKGWLHAIDSVVWAEEGNPESQGMQLAAHHSVDVAPFFIVRSAHGEEQIHTSALRFIREVLETQEPIQAIESTIGIPNQDAFSTPQEWIEWVLSHFGDECAIAFSGAEDVVLIDMAARTGLDFSVFCLDTGRLHPETYQFIERVQKKYSVKIQLMFPQTESVQQLVAQKGLFSFYEDGHKECCGIRKVEPLRRALKHFKAWITGQRKDQSPNTRNALEIVHMDTFFEGKEGSLLKLNPLAEWSSQKVWGYIRQQDVPYNTLHEKGFISIGCEPCTRAIRPGEHERAGRWWWEESTQRECGLHIKSTPSG